jgi:hypothetical protein
VDVGLGCRDPAGGDPTELPASPSTTEQRLDRLEVEFAELRQVTTELAQRVGVAPPRSV